jgi:predicted Zn finger-like uncharacterized protein
MKSEEIICPICQNSINIKKIDLKGQNVKCPKCNSIFQIFGNSSNESTNVVEVNKLSENNNKSVINQALNFQIFNLYVYIEKLIPIIFGIILIAIGAYISLYLSEKYISVGLAFIIIGISVLFLTSEIIQSQERPIIRFIKSEKIIILFTIWIIISILITLKSDFKIFLIVVIIGFMIIKELTKSTSSEKINKRMKIFMIAMLLTYLMLVVEEIATYLSS